MTSSRKLARTLAPNLRGALGCSVLLSLAAACSSAAPEDTAPAAPPVQPSAPAPDPAPAPHVGACPEGEAFTLQSGKIVVDVTLDDGPRQRWVLDTGAFTSVADKSIAAQVRGRDVKVSVGGIDKTVAFDVSDVKTAMRMDVAGVLGQDVFGDVLTIDYPRKRFFIDAALDANREADLRACAHLQGAPATVDAIYEYYLHVRGTIEGKPGWFLVDSGASLGATRKSFFAALDAAHPRPSLHGFYTPAAIGTFWAELATIGSMEVGGHAVQHIVTRTVDDKILAPPKGVASEEFIGVLPSLYLRHFMVTANFKEKKLRLDPAKDDPLREPAVLFPVGIGLEERLAPPVIVSEVLAGSAAAEAGITPGDEITEIDGTPVADLEPYSRPFMLAPSKNGAEVSITYVHGGVTTSTTLVAKDLLSSPTP